MVSRTLLVDLPSDRSYTLDQFVALQETAVTTLSSQLQGKNLEVENAVNDLLYVLTSYPLDKHIDRVSTDEVTRIRTHYQHFFYAALLNATKSSLNALKKRVSAVTMTKLASAATASTNAAMQRPFFETEVRIQSGAVKLSPSIDDVQHSINRCAKAILACSKMLFDWGQAGMPDDLKRSFFDSITRDMEVVRVVILLTGALQSLRQRSAAYLATFERFDWLWQTEIDAAYQAFVAKKPSLDDYERELLRFGACARCAVREPAARRATTALAVTLVCLSHSQARWRRTSARSRTPSPSAPSPSPPSP